MPERVPVRAVRNGGTDFIEVPTRDEAAVAALLRERRGYVLRDLPDRIAGVDAELRRLGVEPPAEPKKETPDGTEQRVRPDRRRRGQPAGGRGAAGRG